MVKRTKGTSRNYLLRKSLPRFSRSQMYHFTGKWATKKFMKPVEKKAAPKKEEKKATKKVTYKFPTQRNASPLSERNARIRRNFHPRTAMLRKSLTPGTVCIMLAGRFRGKRVIYLKQLKSGLMLVTGPYKINGVPLRRVSSAYVIATSTRVNVKGVKIDDKVINDSIFLRDHNKKRTKSEREFFKSQPDKKKKCKLDWEIKKHEVTAPRKEAQKAIDSVILAEIKKTPLLKEYLSARFSLTNNQHPHLMKF